jgi:hypothetical protein
VGKVKEGGEGKGRARRGEVGKEKKQRRGGRREEVRGGIEVKREGSSGRSK